MSRVFESLRANLFNTQSQKERETVEISGVVSRIKSTGEVLDTKKQGFFYGVEEELILEGEPTAIERLKFQKMLEDGFIVLESGEVKIMRTTKSGIRYCQGSINLLTGYVHSSEPARVSGSLLYLVRELASGNSSVTSTIQTDVEPLNQEIKNASSEGKQKRPRSPYAPPSRR